MYLHTKRLCMLLRYVLGKLNEGVLLLKSILLLWEDVISVFSFDSYKPPARFHVVVNNVEVWLHQVVIEPCS